MRLIRGLITFVAVLVACYVLYWAWTGMTHGGWSPPGLGGGSTGGGGGGMRSFRKFSW